MSNGGEGDDGYSANEAWDQVLWDFETKGGYDADTFYDDPADDEARSADWRRVYKSFLAVASPQERAALKAALGQLRRGEELNWAAVARDLGKSSGAIKTQVRRVLAKFDRSLGLEEDD
jgi:DNA-directed RNA polymerase specialized sigma24 family protein